MKKKIPKLLAPGIVHHAPDDIQKAIFADTIVADIWNGLTPLARNEWVCWVISVKKPVTRQKHIERMILELKQGKRRPCCWYGCPHRADKLLNRTQVWLAKRKTRPIN